MRPRTFLPVCTRAESANSRPLFFAERLLPLVSFNRDVSLDLLKSRDDDVILVKHCRRTAATWSVLAWKVSCASLVDHESTHAPLPT